MAKVLDCGQNKFSAPTPVYGFGLGPNKTKAKSVAMDTAYAFADTLANTESAKWKCPEDKGCPNKRGPVVANLKTTELLTVKLQKLLYLSVVQRTFDIVIHCQGS
jgi:hypothetical protein